MKREPFDRELEQVLREKGDPGAVFGGGGGESPLPRPETGSESLDKRRMQR